jgi:hypothetical protein
MLQDNTLFVKVYGIPSKWGVCCWLADALTTALMKSKRADAHKNMLDILNILAIVCAEVTEPTLLREHIFDLMTRILHKTKYLLQTNKDTKIICPETDQDQSKVHESLYGLSADFLGNVYNQIKKYKDA